MIVLVTGPPGSGKSFYALRKLADALDSGRPVATNVELAPDACRRIALSNPVRRLLGRVASSEQRMQRALYVSGTLGELFSLRLRGRGEGRGVMVLDEAHYWLNARNWGAADRENVVTFFTQHRKLGWDVYLIVQDPEMIDKQVRKLIEFHVELKNLRRVKVGMGLLPLSPVNLFLANWWWHGMRHTKPVKRELNRLTWQRRLYDTHQLHHGVEAEGDASAVWLPRDPEGAGGSAASASESAGPSASNGGRRWRRRGGDDQAGAVEPAKPGLTTPVTVLIGGGAAAAGDPPPRVSSPAHTLPSPDAGVDVEPGRRPGSGIGPSNSRSRLTSETRPTEPGPFR